jgi:hypothetical protein
VVDKFHWLGEPFADDTLRSEIVSAVEGLDDIRTAELTGLLGAVSPRRNDAAAAADCEPAARGLIDYRDNRVDRI